MAESGAPIIFESEEMTTSVRGSKDGYLQTFFGLLRMFGQLVANADPSSMRTSLFVDLMIATITDEEKQIEAYKLKETRIAEALSAYKEERNLSTLDESTKRLIENQISIRLVGDIVAWYDGEIAITHYKEIGTVH